MKRMKYPWVLKLGCVMASALCSIPIAAVAMGISDGAGRVTGIIVDEQNADLHDRRLELLAELKDEVLIFSIVQSRFTETFVLQPKPRSCGLRISCPDSLEIRVSKAVALGEIKNYRIPVDLGLIAVKRWRQRN